MISLLSFLLIMLQTVTTIAADVPSWNHLSGVTEREMVERRNIEQKAEQLLLSGQFGKK